jgi:hypothetical protein
MRWKRPRRRTTNTPPVGFDDADFSELCSLVRDLRALRGGDWSVGGRVFRGVLRSAALLRSVARLPSEALYLSAGPSGRYIRALLPRRLMDARRLVAISTLTLPKSFEDYVRGRSRQAFRTNCSRARQAGVTIEQVNDPACARQRVHEVFTGRNTPADAAWSVRRTELQEGEFWFAVDAGRRTLVFAEIIVDDEAAMLNAMIAARRSGSSEARYLLMAELFRSLSQRGVHHVVVNRALSLPPGLIYFQKLLGFSPKNLKVVTRERVRPVSPRRSLTTHPSHEGGPPR